MLCIMQNTSPIQSNPLQKMAQRVPLQMTDHYADMKKEVEQCVLISAQLFWGRNHRNS